MASIGDLVQAKSGLMYDKDSPQGKTIVNAQKRAAASAAQSNSFTADSSALNTTDISPVLNTIADDVDVNSFICQQEFGSLSLYNNHNLLTYARQKSF